MIACSKAASLGIVPCAVLLRGDPCVPTVVLAPDPSIGQHIVLGTSDSSTLCVSGPWRELNGVWGTMLLYSGTQAGLPMFESEFVPSSIVVQDEFPVSPCCRSGTTVAGAPLDDSPNGLNAGFALVWPTQDAPESEHILLAPNGAPHDFFGVRLACTADAIGVVSGQDIVDGQRCGSVWVFNKIGDEWQPASYLHPEDPLTGDAYGIALVFGDDELFVGMQGDEREPRLSGWVFRYVKQADGTWTLAETIQHPNPRPGDLMGTSLDYDHDVLVAGAPRPTVDGIGTAHVFRRTDGVFVHEAELIPDDPDLAPPLTMVGYSVAVEGDRVVVGMLPNTVSAPVPPYRPERAYVFERIDGSWIQTRILEPSPDDEKAWACVKVELANGWALLGAPLSDAGAVDAGAIFAYDLDACVPCPGDLDGDGMVGFDDLLQVLAHWGTSAFAGDANHDGAVDFADVLLVLAGWGEC